MEQRNVKSVKIVINRTKINFSLVVCFYVATTTATTVLLSNPLSRFYVSPLPPSSSWMVIYSVYCALLLQFAFCFAIFNGEFYTSLNLFKLLCGQPLLHRQRTRLCHQRKQQQQQQRPFLSDMVDRDRTGMSQRDTIRSRHQQAPS